MVELSDIIKKGDPVYLIHGKGVLFGEITDIQETETEVKLNYATKDPAGCGVEMVAQALRESSVAGMQVGGEHYQGKKIQPVEYIHANNMNFTDGSIVKYISRHKEKNGAQDIMKIVSFCKLILILDYGYTKEQIKEFFNEGE